MKLPDYLDKNQIDGVRWILSRRRSYLAHAPGAGKTCQAITAAMLTPGEGKVLFIVPPTLTLNWEREIMMWHYARFGTSATWPRITIVPKSADERLIAWRGEYIICADSMLTKRWVIDSLAKLQFRFTAVDEASRFKEPLAQRSIALFGGEFKSKIGKEKTTIRSPGFVQRPKHVVLMDGSPMPNRPIELWAPTINLAPEAIDSMSYHDFGFRYCGATLNDWGAWEFKNSSNEEELRFRLQKNFMHVVTEEQLDHPERLRSILFMNEDVRTLQQKAWEEKNLSKFKLSELSEESSQGEIAKYRRELGIKKIPWVANYVRERLEKGESILLFAWHRDVCTGLRDVLLKFQPHILMGGTTKEYRESALKSFQEGTAKLLIGNIGALGRGHNIQRASRVIFAEWSWTDELNKQAEKRVSRKGNTAKTVRADYIACPNSLDEIVLRSNFNKETRVRRIIG